MWAWPSTISLSVAAKTTAALVALIAIPALALSLRRSLLSLARSAADVGSGRARAAFMFRVATVPALAAILLIIPFRVPRNWVEVVVVPVVVTMIGIGWIQAGAWAVSRVNVGASLSARSIAYAGSALLLLLLVFQLLLRPGIRFY